MSLNMQLKPIITKDFEGPTPPPFYIAILVCNLFPIHHRRF